MCGIWHDDPKMWYDFVDSKCLQNALHTVNALASRTAVEIARYIP